MSLTLLGLFSSAVFLLQFPPFLLSFSPPFSPFSFSKAPDIASVSNITPLRRDHRGIADLFTSLFFFTSLLFPRESCHFSLIPFLYLAPVSFLSFDDNHRTFFLPLTLSVFSPPPFFLVFPFLLPCSTPKLSPPPPSPGGLNYSSRLGRENILPPRPLFLIQFAFLQTSPFFG